MCCLEHLISFGVTEQNSNFTPKFDTFFIISLILKILDNWLMVQLSPFWTTIIWWVAVRINVEYTTKIWGQTSNSTGPPFWESRSYGSAVCVQCSEKMQEVSDLYRDKSKLCIERTGEYPVYYENPHCDVTKCRVHGVNLYDVTILRSHQLPWQLVRPRCCWLQQLQRTRRFRSVLVVFSFRYDSFALSWITPSWDWVWSTSSRLWCGSPGWWPPTMTVGDWGWTSPCRRRSWIGSWRGRTCW